jgi:hypothetical protein
MSNIHVLELSSYTTPVIQESKRDAWVEFGEDNNYFQFIIDRYVNSTTNSSVINNVSRLIYGRGLSALDASKKPNEYAQMMALFHADCIRKIVLDRKMFGQFAMQIHYSQDHKRILKAYHIPVNLLRAEKCNKDGEIEGYYYSDNWLDVKKYAPKRIPAFGYSNEQIEILYSKPYAVGMKYYALPDYQGGLPYAKLEEEIADYLINEVQKGFAGRVVINFNNGVPTEEQQQIITGKVKSQLTGPRGEKVIIGFNNNQESKTTVDTMPVNDAPDLYNSLSEECVKKIMLAHNVTSPLLFGLGSANGFSSNADELKNASILFDNMVIKPIQDQIIDAFDKILAFNSVSLKLFFKTLQPLEFVDLENAQNEEQVAEETGTELSKDFKIAEALINLGEDEPENSILIDEYEVDYDSDDKENETLSKEPKQSLLSKLVNLVSTGDNRPNISSKQDEVIEGIKFLTRYVYAGKTSADSREFCREMMAANKIYRKEDIIKMGSQVVNEGWGPRGADTYSIWFYKGGGNCHHRWNKRVYATFSGKAIDVNSKELKQVAVKKAEKLGYVVKNSELVSKRPVDMPNYGFLPSNPQPKREITR